MSDHAVPVDAARGAKCLRAVRSSDAEFMVWRLAPGSVRTEEEGLGHEGSIASPRASIGVL